MASRNPGPVLHKAAIGFPSFNAKTGKDAAVRRAFSEGEINTRIYKSIFETLGVTGKILINQKVGQNRIKLRCIQTGKAGGFGRWSQLSRHGFRQIHDEGWLLKYGLDPHRVR